MSSVFTVAVDLSKIKKTAPYLFHILVDPSQMSVFIEFIELVRSMFSITEHIRFVHESKYIHYLEDIRILSVLQQVQAECYEPEECEKERMVLLVATLKFYDKSQNFPKILLSRLRISFDNQTGEIIAVGNKNVHDENPEEDDEASDNVSCSKIDFNIKENGTKEKEITSQIQLLAIEPKKPTDASNFDIDNKKPIENQKQMNISEVDNIIPNEIKKPNFRRSQINRPFTLGGILEALRNQVSNGNNPPEALNNSYQNEFNSTVDNEQDDEAETSNNDSLNKRRKRVRKHRSKKRKIIESPNPCSTPNVTDEAFVPRKMIRHVRFSEAEKSSEAIEADVQVANENLSIDQIYQELQMKKELLANEPKDEANGNGVAAVDIPTENEVDPVPDKTGFPPELNGLLMFKKKNLSPVVFKRFDNKNETA